MAENNSTVDIMSEITNKEDLRDYIHEIHNFLRNSGAAFGMNALKIFNFFYGLSLIDRDEELFLKTGLSDNCRFKELAKIDEGNAMKARLNLILTELHECGNPKKDIKFKRLNQLLFYDIPKKLELDIYLEIINRVSTIQKAEESANVLLSGKLYEYFIGKDKTAISDLGAFFTDRHIVKYIYDKVEPQLNEDGTLPTMIDLFGGSGGFTTGYCNYMIEKNGNCINWDTEVNKIYHIDMNRDVVKTASLEVFGITRSLPNVEKNFMIRNSFKYDFQNELKEDLKFKYIFTNPPYGGDKNKKGANIKKRESTLKEIERKINLYQEKIKETQDTRKIQTIMLVIESLKRNIEILKKEIHDIEENSDDKKVKLLECSSQLREYACKIGLAKETIIKGKLDYITSLNDKESCSVLAMMYLLDEGGSCVAVIKEGFFFDRKYSAIRQKLVENFNVTDVISVPEKQFENTPTKTSIVIFHNKEKKTSSINFYDLIVEKEENNVFVDFIGDHMIEDEDELFKFIELCELCDEDFILKKKLIRQKGDIKKDGVYENLIISVPINSIRRNNYSFNSKEYNKMNIICNEDYELKKLSELVTFLPKSNHPASFGKNKGLYNFYTSSDKILKCDEYDYEGKEGLIIIGDKGDGCIHYENNKFSCAAGANVLKTNEINNLFIFLSLNSIRDQLLSLMYGSVVKTISKEKIGDFQIVLPKNIDKMNYWIQMMSEKYSIFKESEKNLKIIEEMIMKKISEVIEQNECQNKTIQELCDIHYGKRIVKKDTNPGIYDVYGGGDKTFTADIYNREGFNIIIGRFAISEECVRIKYEKLFLNDSGMTIHTINNDSTLLKYIGYYLLNHQNFIMESTNGSIQKNIDIHLFNNIQIPVPNDEILKEFNDLFCNIEKYYLLAQQKEKEYEELIQQFRSESIQEIRYGLSDEVDEVDEEESKEDDASISTKSSKTSKSSSSSKKDDGIPLCKGHFKDGSSCTFKAKNDGYCGKHMPKLVVLPEADEPEIEGKKKKKVPTKK